VILLTFNATYGVDLRLPDATGRYQVVTYGDYGVSVGGI